MEYIFVKKDTTIELGEHTESLILRKLNNWNSIVTNYCTLKTDNENSLNVFKRVKSITRNTKGTFTVVPMTKGIKIHGALLKGKRNFRGENC